MITSEMISRRGFLTAGAASAFALMGLSACGSTAETSKKEVSTVTGISVDNTKSDDGKKESGPTQINVGETFTIPDMFEVTLGSAEWTTIVEPSDTSNFYTYHDEQEGKSYYVIHGTLKNIGTETFRLGGGVTVHLSASMKMNGKYDIDANVEVDDGSSFASDIEPLISKPLLIVASASNEIKDAFEGCEVTLTARKPREDGVWHSDDDPVGEYVASFA